MTTAGPLQEWKRPGEPFRLSVVAALDQHLSFVSIYIAKIE